MRKHFLFLAGILILALGTRAALLTRIAPNDYYAAPWYHGDGGDAAEYSGIAKNIVAGHGFSLHSQPTSIRPPLYVFFLAGVYSLFGVDNFTAVRIAQILIAGISLVLFWYLALRITRYHWVAHLATLALGLYPRFAAYNLVLLSETLFFALILAMLWFAIRWHAVQRAPLLTASFGFLALAALTRPAALYFAPFLVLWVWWTQSRKKTFAPLLTKEGLGEVNQHTPPSLPLPRGGIMRLLSSGLLLFFVLTGAWVFRNYTQFHSFTFSSKSGGTVAEAWDRTILEPLGISNRDILAPYKHLSEEEFAKIGYTLFFTEIRDHPIFIAKVLLLKSIYWFSPTVKSPSILFRTLNALFMSLVFMGGAAGLALYWRKFGPAIPSLFLLLFWAFTTMHALTVPYHRYRFPIMDPYLILFAAYFVVECWDKILCAKKTTRI